MGIIQFSGVFGVQRSDIALAHLHIINRLLSLICQQFGSVCALLLSADLSHQHVYHQRTHQQLNADQ
ncbi:hypothetical protein AAFN90_00770 [Erwiniaceae bacterium CAU 1747]